MAIALVATSSRPKPAYAVSGGNGEEVTVTVTRLEGAEALQGELRSRGIAADLFKVTIPPGAVGQGSTFVLSAAVTPIDNGVRAIVDFGVAQGVVAPCMVVDAR